MGCDPGLERDMNTTVAIIGVMLPTLIVGLFVYFAYLTEGAEREGRQLVGSEFEMQRCPQCKSDRIRRSKRRGLIERVLAIVSLRPFRCGDCKHRFFRTTWRLRMGTGNLRILIVDDSETTRRTVGTILRSRHWIICGEAEDGRTGIEKFQELRPDIVLLDLSMPDMTGIEAAQQMSAADPEVPLILFTILEIEGIGDAAREAGIRAIVPKSEAWSLIPSIESIANQQAS